jgi:COMPASS component SWD3
MHFNVKFYLKLLLINIYYSDNTLRIWDTENSKEIGILEGHESRIWDVSSNKNGSMVSSASGDGSIKVYDCI